MTAGPPQDKVRPENRPTMPGGPYLFPVSPALKTAYVCNAIVIGLIVTFAQFLFIGNISQIAGQFGLTSAQATWASAAYYGFGASNALVVIKGRIQFGTRRLFILVMAIYAASSVLLLIHPSFATLIINRAANGAAYSMGIVKSVYYMLLVVPASRRYLAPLVALGTLQLSSTFSGLVPVDVVVADGALGFRAICLAIPCVLMALVLLFPMTPTDRIRMFEWRDLITVSLIVPGVVLMAAAISQGRTYWWWTVPWLGWMLMGAVALITTGLIHEYGRQRPMLHLEWMTSSQLLLLIFVVVFERIGLAEQTAGVRGLLGSLGYDNDQYHGLFIAIGCGQLLGMAVLAAIFKPERVNAIMLTAMLMTAAASWLDGGNNAFLGPDSVVVTQAVLGAAGVMFLVAGLLYILGQVMASGPYNLVSMVVLFAFTQNIGGLFGSVLVSSYQFADMQAILQSHAGWLAGGTEAGRQGLLGLAQGQAQVLAYLDSFRFVSLLTLFGAAGLACLQIVMLLRNKEKSQTS